jgi:hypothetical protein
MITIDGNLLILVVFDGISQRSLSPTFLNGSGRICVNRTFFAELGCRSSSDLKDIILRERVNRYSDND